MWVFDETADIKEHDVLSSSKFDEDFVVERVMIFDSLGGVFHHYEVYATEHQGTI